MTTTDPILHRLTDDDLDRARWDIREAVETSRSQVVRYVDAVELFGIVGAECPSTRSLQLATFTIDEALEVIEHVRERLVAAREALARAEVTV